MLQGPAFCYLESHRRMQKRSCSGFKHADCCCLNCGTRYCFHSPRCLLLRVFRSLKVYREPCAHYCFDSCAHLGVLSSRLRNSSFWVGGAMKKRSVSAFLGVRHHWSSFGGQLLWEWDYRWADDDSLARDIPPKFCRLSETECIPPNEVDRLFRPRTLRSNFWRAHPTTKWENHRCRWFLASRPQV